LIHTVVCTDVNRSVDWQCRLLEYTWKRAAQSGELLRLVTCAADVTLPSHTHARVCRVDPQPGQTMGYKAFERLFALQQWLERERPRGTVLILDPDCVFRRAIDQPVEAGTPRAQHWVDYRCESELTQAATWPMLIDAGDLQALLPSWISFTAAVYRATHRWESDMYALVSAASVGGLRFSLDAVGAYVGWPDELVGQAPIVHYCQDVVDDEGRTIWAKRSYRPWDAVPNASRAKLAYCRDLLSLVNEHALLQRQTRAPG